MATLRYGSVCSGIEAATMAWHSLGWTPAFFSEIEPFPSAVLAHYYGSNMPREPLAKNGIPAPDGPRYKALGNSMAVNVMRWIGQRIDLMENLIATGKVPTHGEAR
ncbi:hypothetical protein ACU8LZ_12745 [Rhizobium leguminosarum]